MSVLLQTTVVIKIRQLATTPRLPQDIAANAKLVMGAESSLSPGAKVSAEFTIQDLPTSIKQKVYNNLSFLAMKNK